MKHITVFDRPYPADKQAEGMAVSWAVVSGACTSCGYHKECESTETFRFPADAACMKRMQLIIREMAAGKGRPR